MNYRFQTAYEKEGATTKFSTEKLSQKISSMAESFFSKTVAGLFYLFIYFLYLGFLSKIFTNHRPAREGTGHFFNSSVPLPTTSQTLRH